MSAAAQDPFLTEWRFPSGRTARTVDDLVQGCVAEWSAAKNSLIRHEFQQYFWDNGRNDLAKLIPSVEPDADAALQTFLERLPSRHKLAPALDVAPRRLHVTDVRRGEDRTAIFTLINRGNGLLFGDLAVVDAPPWLKLQTTQIRTRTEQPLEVTIESRALPSVGSYFARLQIRTNGGAIEVPVQVDVSVPGVAFHGYSVSDPHDLAKLMHAHPKKAAKWLADGSVQTLFDQEGWSFPLTGYLAPSLGAVQQYFEALRLSSIPAVEPDATEFDVTCEYPEVATRSFALSTASKKWVYAFIESGAMWLKPRELAVAGARRADIVFDIDSEMMEPGRRHEAVLRLTVNGGAEHTVWVRVDVVRPFEPWTRKFMKPFTR